jgi:hypothetical protein
MHVDYTFIFVLLLVLSAYEDYACQARALGL